MQTVPGISLKIAWYNYDLGKFLQIESFLILDIIILLQLYVIP